MNENLTYAKALKAVKKGKLIARKGWNGKNMFVFMRPADEIPVNLVVNTVKSLPQAVKEYFKPYQSFHETDSNLDSGHETVVKFTAYLCMKSADGSIVNGWLASQTDMLAEDWCIL